MLLVITALEVVSSKSFSGFPIKPMPPRHQVMINIISPSFSPNHHSSMKILIFTKSSFDLNQNYCTDYLSIIERNYHLIIIYPRSSLTDPRNHSMPNEPHILWAKWQAYPYQQQGETRFRSHDMPPYTLAYLANPRGGIRHTPQATKGVGYRLQWQNIRGIWAPCIELPQWTPQHLSQARAQNAWIGEHK